MSLSGIYDVQNIFAKILRGEIPKVQIMENDDVIAIMDAFPQSEGHCLIIPKQASRNLLDTDPAVLTEVMAATQQLTRAIKAALKPDGIRIAQFNGGPAGQTVFHLHFHIIPVWEGRSLGAHAGQMADPAELENTATKIRAAL